MSDILITEVNSKATGGDFFELYNFGSTVIDLSDWRWTDSSGSTINTFPSGTTLAAGQRLLVINEVDVATFRSSWGLDESQQIIAFDGPGLGKGDGMVIVDASNELVAGFNYDSSDFSAPASMGSHVISPANKTGGGTANGEHAGVSFGGSTDGVSAVWDGVSTSSPTYSAAAAGTMGAYAQTGDSESIGSPGGAFILIDYGAGTLTEADANDGSFTTTLTLTLYGDTFASDLTGLFSISNVPAGLTAELTRTGDTTATLALTGSATDHADSNDTSNLTVTFDDAAFITNEAAMVLNASKTDLAIDFNDPVAAVSLAFTGPAFQESRAYDGSVTGTTTITLSGDTFSGTNGSSLLGSATIDNIPAGLTAVLTRTSDTTATLAFTGTADNHTDAQDVNNLTLTFLDAAFTNGNAIAVGGNGQSGGQINFGEPDTGSQTFKPNGQGSDPSSALALDANYMVVGDDEENVLRVYERQGGDALTLNHHNNSSGWNYGNELGINDELDLEAGTRIGDTFYFTGSSSNKKSGADHDSRENLFSVQISGTGSDTTFSNASKLGNDNLETLLTEWDSTNTHGKGADYFGFSTASADGVVTEDASGFSIEGMTAKASANTLLLGFRAPQSDTLTREKAILVELNLGTDGSLSGATFGNVHELNLGGRGIRSIELSASGNDYLILAGPAGGASTTVTHDFRLFRWDGSSDTPTELDINLDALRDSTHGSFESIVDVVSTAQGTWVQLLQDNGDTVWSGQTDISKDLPGSEQQFVGNWIQIGADINDTAGPVLQSSTPADDATGTSVDTNLILNFDEGIKIGSGNLLIKKSSDDSTVATIAINDSDQVTLSFNTLTINPTVQLEANTEFYVEAAAGVLTDHYGNDWTGFADSTTFSFTTGEPLPPQKLIITEINSNADGGDFFELYNYGDTTIDMAGWKWIDSKADPEHEDAREFTGITELAPGARLVVITDETDITEFRSQWNISTDIAVTAGSTGGAGLGGSGDGVVVFDTFGKVVTALNYSTDDITATDGTVISPLTRADGEALVSGHAGESVGAADGNKGVSAVWDGSDPTNPAYQPAVAGQGGAVAQSDDNTHVGSPGAVALPTVIISEVNSSTSSGEGGGDFFELYNYGNTTVDLSGWKWTDEAADFADADKVSEFPEGTELAPGEKLIVVSSDDVDAFRSAWNDLPETTRVIALDGQGLGGDDSVFVFNSYGTVVTAVSYKAAGGSAVTASDGTVIHPFAGSIGGHTGEAAGASRGASLVWDGASVTNPAYTAAVVDSDAAFAQTDISENIGSPGQVKDARQEAPRFVSITATDADKSEGDGSTKIFTFTVSRSGADSGAFSVSWAIAGSGNNPVTAADFKNGLMPDGGTLQFAAYEQTKTISIEVAGDSSVEADEQFTVTLDDANDVTISSEAGSAQGVIRNDDAEAPAEPSPQPEPEPEPAPGEPVIVEGSDESEEIIVPDDQLVTTIITGGGNDIIIGGAGTETVIVPVTLNEVLELGVTRDENGTLVLNTPTGQVTLQGVERVQLSDGNLFAFDVELPGPDSAGGHTGQVLAIAYAGLGLQLDASTTQQLSEWVRLADTQDDFAGLAQEIINIVAPDISNQDLVLHLFARATGRAATAEELTFWSSQIGEGQTYETQGELLAMVASLPEFTGPLVDLIGAPQVQLDASVFGL